MKYFRLILAVVLLIVGFAWLYLLNDQYYSNSLGCIACCSISAAFCVWELCSWAKLEAPSRWAAGLLLFADLGLVILLTVGLAEARQRQEEFNRQRGIDGSSISQCGAERQLSKPGA
jgi:hypothetical protein